MFAVSMVAYVSQQSCLQPNTAGLQANFPPPNFKKFSFDQIDNWKWLGLEGKGWWQLAAPAATIHVALLSVWSRTCSHSHRPCNPTVCLIQGLPLLLLWPYCLSGPGLAPAFAVSTVTATSEGQF